MRQLKKQRALLRRQRRSQAIAKDGGFFGRMINKFFKKFKGPARPGVPGAPSAPLSPEEQHRRMIELAKKDYLSQFSGDIPKGTLPSSTAKEKEGDPKEKDIRRV
jgi:hypothetical protein